MRACTRAALGLAGIALASGCYEMRSSHGGGQTRFEPPRRINAADIALPEGYVAEVVATQLTFPTGVAFDDDDRPHVVESGYSYGEVWTTPRLLRVERDGQLTELARGGRNGPWNGVAYADGAFYVAEGGELDGGRILRITGNGRMQILVRDLPSMGDHHTNGPALGPDGRLYFGVGTATNSGVVGRDNAQFGWLKRKPAFHDTPCRDIRLSGKNFRIADPLGGDEGKIVSTGAYVPFGTLTSQNQRIPGRLPCNGAVFRMQPDGSQLELVAWGFRNPFGLAFAPDRRLYVTDNGYDDRGARPVWGAADHLWEVKEGLWYGWPDYSGDRPLTDGEFHPPPGKVAVEFLLAEHPNRPPRPAALLGVHSSSNGLDFSRSALFGHVGNAFIAQFGDLAPTTGKVWSPVGFKVVRVNVRNGTIQDFAVNGGGRSGPASNIGGGGLERPVAVRFNREGTALYVVDFGVFLETPHGSAPQPRTGVLWRITRRNAP